MATQLNANNFYSLTDCGAVTARTITDSQIRGLRVDAMCAGDARYVKFCDNALARRGGRGDCAVLINMGCYIPAVA